MADQKPRRPADSVDDRERARRLLEDSGLATVPDPAPEDELETLAALTAELHSLLDPDEVAERILELARTRTSSERGIVFGVEEPEDRLVALASYGFGENETEEPTGYSRTVVERARELLPVESADLQSDQRFLGAESATLHQIRSVVCVPFIHRQRAIGAIYLDNRTSGRRIPEKSQRFLSLLTGLGAGALANASRFRDLERRTAALTDELASGHRFEEIVGTSEAMQKLLRDVERVARTDFPVFIVGESGTGKELVARALHQASRRREEAFVAQNCAAIPNELLESEFFGFERGAFTGAVRKREGVFRLADGGSLFLDEIADLDRALQAKLLRVLENGLIRPLGSDREVGVDVRILCATSTSIDEAVQQSRFRQDLFFRLNVFRITVPALRERREDIPLLVRHFLDRHEDAAAGRRVTFSRSGMQALREHSWPGNVRELEHFVKRALVLAERPVLEANDVRRLLSGQTLEEESAPPVLNALTLAQLEEMAIRNALTRSNGNKARAAALLGIHRNAFLRRLQKLESSEGGSRRPMHDHSPKNEGADE
ncbi:MAG: sigma-54-dependent Fis family transcriptional regulator [bacterium]